MASKTTLHALQTGGLVVVARRLAPIHLFPVAQALIEAGAPALEITLDDPLAVEMIADLNTRLGAQLLLGAGTALRVADVEAALAAGARFVVSPVFVPAIMHLCQEANVLYFPGAITPDEIFKALESGAQAIKLFPSSLISPTYVRDILAPLHSYNPVFMLTGGLDHTKIPDYLEAGVSIIGVGGNILDADALTTRQYDRITARARLILTTIQGIAR